jgi:hypothetical protein
MARVPTKASLIAGAGFMLAACGLIPGTSEDGAAPQQNAALPAQPAATPATAGPIPRPPPPKPVPPADPLAAVKLVGLDRGGTQELLGPPVVETEAGSAKVWMYKSGQCQLDVFFSYDLARADFYVLSYSVNRGSGTPDAERQCLTRLAHDRTR